MSRGNKVSAERKGESAYRSDNVWPRLDGL